jgi:hypothetical protein
VTRVLICSGLQIMFVTLYGAWAMFRPEEAFGWMLPFVGVVLALMIYNEWEPISDAWRRRRR